MRLIKLMRFTKRNASVSGYLNKVFNISGQAANMLKLAFMVLFLTHLVACAWFMQAKWLDFEENCWVVQEGMDTESIGM